MAANCLDLNVLKDCDQKVMIGFDCICLCYDTFFMTYHPSYTQIGHFMGRVTVYRNLNSNMVEVVGCPVLAAR